MARPIRNNAEFFYHPASLRDDRRVKAIRARSGPAGYGILIMILETLTDADFTQLDTSELELELLSGDYGVSVTEIHSLLQIGEKVGYFTRNDAGFLICPDLNKALEPVFEKRNRSRNSANSDRNEQKTGEPIVSVTETPQSVTESTQKIVKDKIVKDKKKKSVDKPPEAELSFPSFATESFHLVWVQLRQSDKWRGKSPDSLQLSLNKLAKYDEPFAIQLMQDAIEGNWQGVVFGRKGNLPGTDDQWHEWQRQSNIRPLHTHSNNTTYQELLKPEYR